ncbi:MAG: polysaccharide biosynthesis tyrosine autokinase [Thermodesulfobacteriota bacterium]
MDEKEIHLRDYLRVISKRKGMIFTFFVITLLTVIIATFTATPMYRSAAKVMIEKNTAREFTGGYRYTGYDPAFAETQTQLIKSAAVIKQAVKNLNPDKIYDSFFINKEEKKSYIGGLKAWIKDQYLALKSAVGIEKIFSSSGETIKKKIPQNKVPLTKAEKLENIIKAGISVEPVENSKILRIGYISDNPALAKKIANFVAQAYIDELIDMQMEVSGYSIGWMKKKAEIQRVKLEESEKDLHAYKKKHNIVTIENRVAVLPERLSELSSKLTAAETKMKELIAVYNQITNAKQHQLETIPVIAKDISVDSINKKILAADQKVSELSKKYGYKHPKMIAAKNELQTLKDKKNSELQKAVKTIKNEYLLAKSNESDLKKLLDQTKFEAARLGEKSIQLGILQRKVETNRYLYDALVKKMKERGITEKSQAVNVWIIEQASFPERPSSPRKKRNILLGIILGLFGGIGLAFFFEYLDNTVKSPENVEEKFDIPVIGTIDILKSSKETIVENVLGQTGSTISESFKGIRTSILLSSADTPPKILLITSVAPGEGKSSISACLAAAIAETGKKVLLIDSDMRRPVQHKNFNLENTAGISSFLAGISEKNENRKQTSTENLDIITAGPLPPNPSELLSSMRLQDMLKDYSNEYDMIIIDSPPLASVTDPLILSSHVDGIILVTWAGKTTYEMLGKGLKQLKEINAPVTGLVLNRFNAKKSGYYYNYGDYYYSSDS